MKSDHRGWALALCLGICCLAGEVWAVRCAAKRSPCQQKWERGYLNSRGVRSHIWFGAWPVGQYTHDLSILTVDFKASQQLARGILLGGVGALIDMSFDFWTHNTPTEQVEGLDILDLKTLPLQFRLGQKHWHVGVGATVTRFLHINLPGQFNQQGRFERVSIALPRAHLGLRFWGHLFAHLEFEMLAWDLENLRILSDISYYRWGTRLTFQAIYHAEQAQFRDTSFSPVAGVGRILDWERRFLDLRLIIELNTFWMAGVRKYTRFPPVSIVVGIRYRHHILQRFNERRLGALASQGTSLTEAEGGRFAFSLGLNFAWDSRIMGFCGK